MKTALVPWTPLAATAAALTLAAAGGATWLVAIGAGIAAFAADHARSEMRRARELQRAAEATAQNAQQLRTALQRRDEQLAHTAHELRTPLTSVVTALAMLREGYATSPEETNEFLEQATLAARHLAFLINDVLDEAALASGRLRLSVGEHSVRELLKDGGQVMGLQTQRRGVTLRVPNVDPRLIVRTDPRRFQQVVFNLVGNALKFSTPGDDIELQVEERGDRLRFRVVDKGPGVPQELRERLFSAFATADDPANHQAPSTGLGLHVCRRIVEQLGGAIGYEPGEVRGSVFWFDQLRGGGSSPAAAADDGVVAAEPALQR